jgi:hypothetical protein
VRSEKLLYLYLYQLVLVAKATMPAVYIISNNSLCLGACCVPCALRLCLFAHGIALLLRLTVLRPFLTEQTLKQIIVLVILGPSENRGRHK